MGTETGAKKIGGEVTRDRYGPEFFQEIGSKGGKKKGDTKRRLGEANGRSRKRRALVS